MNWRNKIVEQYVLPLGDLVTGGSFMRHLRRLRWETAQSADYLQALQLKRLDSMLNHATAHSSYYKALQISAGQDVVSRLQSFPILDKQTLQQQQAALCTLPERHLLRQASSGSSGQRSEVFWTKEEQSIHRATQILWWEWAGYKLGAPILQTGMTPERGFIKTIKDKLLSTYYMVAFVPTEQSLHSALHWAAHQKHPFLGGYASSLYVLSQYAGHIPQPPQFAGAISWGDKLFDHYRRSIESAFDTKVYETYGTAEGMMMAAQKDLPYMYIMTPNVYIEILDDEGNEVPDGTMGHVVVTSLVAKAMPLIRYKIGDLAVKLPQAAYPKKRELALPLLQKVIGRDTDIVKTHSGKSLVVHSFTGIFEHIREIRQFCVIQETLDSIRIQYIPAHDFRPDILSHITQKIQSYLQEPAFSIEYEPVSFIPPTPSGKPQIIQSLIWKNGATNSNTPG